MVGSAARRASRAVGVVIAVALTGGPLAMAPAGAVEARSEPATDAAPGGFEVVEREVDLDDGRVEVVHRGEPQMLILPDVPPATTLAIRSRNDGDWSDWITVTADPAEGPDGGTGEGAEGARGVGPIWIGDDAERTEIAVLEGHADELTVEELRVDVDAAPAVDAGATGGRANLRSAPSLAAASVAAPQPTIRPRSSWATSDMGWRCSGAPDTSDNLRAAVVHHTASTTSYSQSDVPDILRGFWRYHAITNGWCDVAYNFFVDRFGTIWEGRAGGIDRPVVGGHAKGFNTWTTGVALVGEFGSAPAYSAMIDATRRLLAWKLALHGVDPLGWTELENRAADPPMKYRTGAVVRVPTVLGHRDLGLTSCPGTNVYDVLGSIRRGLATPTRVGSPPYVFERWRPSATGISVATVDGRGGIRAAGGAAQTDVTVSGTPIAIDGGSGRGYVLTSDGRLTPFGGAAARPGVAVADAVDLVVRRDGGSGWILQRSGRLVGWGGAADTGVPDAGGRAVAAAVDDRGRGYVLTAGGQLLAFGGAPARSVPLPSGAQGIDLVLRGDGTTGWVLTADGAARGFGGTPTHARAAGSSAPRAIVLAGDESGVSVLDADSRLWPLGGAPAVLPVASHVGIPNAIDAGRLGRPDLPARDLSKVVTAQHQLFLRAAPDAAAVERWYYRAERVGLVATALEMTRSDAYAGLIVDDLYRRVLGRAADPAGRAGWLDAIRRGMRIETIAASFYGSTEYVQRAGSYDRFVELLYENLLFRPSDPGGKANWVDALRSGRLSPTAVAAGFYGSVESRRDRVTRLYQLVLRRSPDPGGLQHWSGQLITKDDLVLAADLAGSQEFRNRAVQGS